MSTGEPSATAGYGLPWVEKNLDIEDYLLVPLNGEDLVARLHELSHWESSTSSSQLHWFPG